MYWKMRLGKQLFCLVGIHDNRADWKLESMLTAQEVSAAAKLFRELSVWDVADHVIPDTAAEPSLGPLSVSRCGTGMMLPGTSIWLEGLCILHKSHQ